MKYDSIFYSKLKSGRKIKKDRKRKIGVGLTYHVYSRCNERKDLLFHKKFKNLLISVVKMTQKKYTFEIMAYTIMQNHFHFMIRTVNEKDSISIIMQFIKAQFARRYNKMENRTGCFWNERFKDRIIEESDDPVFYSNYLIWYFGYNPVKKKLVKDPRDYGFSGLNYYLDEKYKPLIQMTYSKYFLQLGKTFKERVNKFLVYEKKAIEMYKRNLLFSW